MDCSIVGTVKAFWQMESVIGPKMKELTSKRCVPEEVAASHDFPIENAFVENQIGMAPLLGQVVFQQMVWIYHADVAIKEKHIIQLRMSGNIIG